MQLDVLPMLKLSIAVGIISMVVSGGIYFWVLHYKRKHSDDARRLHEVARKLGVSETRATYVAIAQLPGQLFPAGADHVNKNA